jgi:hypothetical protein
LLKLILLLLNIQKNEDILLLHVFNDSKEVSLVDTNFEGVLPMLDDVCKLLFSLLSLQFLGDEKRARLFPVHFLSLSFLRMFLWHFLRALKSVRNLYP